MIAVMNFILWIEALRCAHSKVLSQSCINQVFAGKLATKYKNKVADMGFGSIKYLCVA